MELGITNLTLAIQDIIEKLIENLPAILASKNVINPNRIQDVRIIYENQTKQSRASTEDIYIEFGNAWLRLVQSHGWEKDCPTIGCFSLEDMTVIMEEVGNTTEWAYILKVSFVLREGPENETKTDEIVAMMTNWIRVNEFELKYEGMHIKFTTLREKNTHTDKEMNDLCKDGDLIMHSTGEFELVGTQENSSKSLMFGLKNTFEEHNDANWELEFCILENGIIYHQENYICCKHFIPKQLY